MPETIILGIDPGTISTGYGIIKVSSNKIDPIDYGCIKPPPKAKLSERYRILFESFNALLEKFNPDEVAVELQYIGRNPRSAMTLSMARGVLILACSIKKIACYEYTPSRVKKSLTGYGQASKLQMQTMAAKMLHLAELPPEDAADALGIALCHQHNKQLKKIEENIL